jgi:hypothetical protein
MLSKILSDFVLLFLFRMCFLFIVNLIDIYVHLSLMWTITSLNKLSFLHMFDQSSGYDVSRCRAVLCNVVAMTSINVTHVSNYSILDIMPVINGNLYVVLARCSSYFRVWQEVVDDLIGVQGSSFWQNIMAGPSEKMRESDEEVFYELLQ